MLARLWKIWNTLTLLMGLQNGPPAMDIIEVPQKTENSTVM